MARIKFKDLHTLLSLKIRKEIKYALILFDSDAPQPSDIYEDGSHTVLTWRIEGVFGTLENKQYFNDIKEKLSLLLNAQSCRAEHLVKGITTDSRAFTALHKKYSKHQEIYSLSSFRGVEDLRLGRTRVVFHQYMKMSVFKRVRVTGYNLVSKGILSVEALDEAVMKYSDNYSKDSYMAGAVYRWIVEKIETGEYYASVKPKRITVSRTQNALNQSKSMFERNYAAFKGYVDFVGLTDKTVAALSKILSLSRPTIYKFIKIYRTLKLVNSIAYIGGVLERATDAAVTKVKIQTKIFKPVKIVNFYKSSRVIISSLFYKPIDNYLNTHNLHTNYTSLTQNA